MSSGRSSAVVVTRPIIPHYQTRALLNRKVSQKDAALPGYLWPPSTNRVAPVDPVEHIGQLGCADRDNPVGRCRPHKAAALQPLGIKRHANAVMPKNFDQVTAFPAKNVKIAGMRITLQLLLNLERQPIHPLAHIGAADRQPHPHPTRNWDHRRANASTTAAAKAGDTEAGIRTRALPANSISIAGTGGGTVTPLPADATST